MSFKQRVGRTCVSVLLCSLNVGIGANAGRFNEAFGQAKVDQQVEFITAQELKAKLARNEPVTIIDVRSATGLPATGNKIKGAIYVKLRRLKSRLAFPPLRDVPRTQEVVTYCACPNDEASVRAAQVLREAGFTRARALKGGWVVWKNANGQVEPMVSGM
ncbi:MAG: rhodanese-like domain-containing protein [Acidobacteriota bacterium]